MPEQSGSSVSSPAPPQPVPDTATVTVRPADTASEDYALRRVPSTWTWPWWGIIQAILGAGTAMFFLNLGGSMVSQFGSVNTFIACGYAFLFQGLLTLPLLKESTTTGLNMDLLSRGLGLGYMGSAITSLIYWVNFLFYFASEGDIMSASITQFTGIPIQVSYLIIGFGFIVLTVRGMKFMAPFQTLSLPIYVVLLGVAFGLALAGPVAGHSAASFASVHPAGTRVGGLAMLQAMATANGLLAIVVLLVNDFARFARKHDPGSRSARIGRGVIAFFPENAMIWFFGVPLGIFFYLSTGEVDPGKYMVTLLGVGGLAFVLLTQTRINVTNVYSGSLALANFFSRTFQFIPGRKFWVYVMLAASTAALFTNALKYSTDVLAFQAVFLFSWIGSILADLLIVKRLLGIGPDFIEYRRAYLPQINWIGLSALLAGSVVGAVLAFGSIAGYIPGHIGIVLNAISGWVALGVASVTHVTVAVIVGGKGYIVRQPEDYPGTEDTLRCPRCHEVVDRNDVVRCPFHDGQWICAHCCMAEKRCHTMCQSTEYLEHIGAERLHVPGPEPGAP